MNFLVTCPACGHQVRTAVPQLPPQAACPSCRVTLVGVVPQSLQPALDDPFAGLGAGQTHPEIPLDPQPSPPGPGVQLGQPGHPPAQTAIQAPAAVFQVQAAAPEEIGLAEIPSVPTPAQPPQAGPPPSDAPPPATTTQRGQKKQKRKPARAQDGDWTTAERLVMRIGEYAPGLFSLKVSLVATGVTYVAMAVGLLGVFILSLGAVMAAVTICALAFLLYAHAVAWLVGGELAFLVSALADMRARRLQIFLAILAAPPVLLWTLAGLVGP